MRHRLSLIPLLLAMFVALAGVPAAASADYKRVYADCTDGTLDGTYTAKELQEAMRNAEANVGDYTECADAITAAQQALAAGGGSSSGGGSNQGGTSGGGSGTTGSGGGSGTTGGSGATSTPSTGGDASSTEPPATPDRQNDARDADAAEKAAALAAATASAEQKAGDEAAELKNTGVPTAALELGGSDTSLPGPLLLTLVACVLAACLAGAGTGVQALRRRRGR